MQYFIISLLASLAASPFVAASPFSASVETKLRQPHGAYSIALENHEVGNTTYLAERSNLEKRTAINVCVKDLTNLAQCVAIGSAVSGVAIAIAALIKTDSNNNDCSVHKGSYDNINYQVSATGNNCDTTAQQSTISGAINNFISTVDTNNICGVQCLQLTHGGTWSGYVLIGASSYDLNSYSCDLAGTFGNCASGGDNNN